MDKAEDTSDIANSLFQLHQTIEFNVQKKKREIVGEYVSWLNQVRELEERVGKMFLLSSFISSVKPVKEKDRQNPSCALSELEKKEFQEQFEALKYRQLDIFRALLAEIKNREKEVDKMRKDIQDITEQCQKEKITEDEGLRMYGRRVILMYL